MGDTDERIKLIEQFKSILQGVAAKSHKLRQLALRLDSDGFHYRSNRLLHFPRGFLHWRGLGLGPGDRSLHRFRSLGHPTCLSACCRSLALLHF
jgi:hypothetical protein